MGTVNRALSFVRIKFKIDPILLHFFSFHCNLCALFHCCRIKICMYKVRHCHGKPLYPQRLSHTVNSLMLSYNGYRNGYPINRMTFDILDVTQWRTEGSMIGDSDTRTWNETSQSKQMSRANDSVAFMSGCMKMGGMPCDNYRTNIILYNGSKYLHLTGSWNK